MVPDTFYYHTVDAVTQNKMDILRSQYVKLADQLSTLLPEGRPKSIALTELENSLMRSIQAFAIAEGTKQELSSSGVE